MAKPRQQIAGGPELDEGVTRATSTVSAKCTCSSVSIAKRPIQTVTRRAWACYLEGTLQLASPPDLLTMSTVASPTLHPRAGVPSTPVLSYDILLEIFHLFIAEDARQLSLIIACVCKE
ncbi:hypothetical protein FB45DRAFT_1032980 [Roridomyces roridus]|uniref:Uncharacterized protein n=1 Tax=Roridomyces roridus TaxID=1738132 RepID=A0AAD7BGU0_9AGAR|nr:hypothetical protein FB45DRAFT_1032980 [Roridomyces roridus]